MCSCWRWSSGARGSWLFKFNTTWEEADAPQVQNTLDSVKDLYKFDDRLIEIEKKLKLQNALVLGPALWRLPELGLLRHRLPQEQHDLRRPRGLGALRQGPQRPYGCGLPGTHRLGDGLRYVLCDAIRTAGARRRSICRTRRWPSGRPTRRTTTCSCLRTCATRAGLLGSSGHNHRQRRAAQQLKRGAACEEVPPCAGAVTRHRDAAGAELPRFFDDRRVDAAEARDLLAPCTRLEPFGEEPAVRVELRLDCRDLRCFRRDVRVAFRAPAAASRRSAPASAAARGRA